MERFRVSPTLTLPLDAMAQTFAVIAPRGGAKTHPATVLVEEMVADRLPVVIIDPRGVWHALRDATDGKAQGLPVHILGGEHGQSELREHVGGFVADWAIDWGQPLVLDLSFLSRSGAARFVADFADQVRFRAPRAMHIVLDEADILLGGAGRGASAIDLVQSASTSGVGVTLVSHHSALLNVVPGVEVLVAARSKDLAEHDAIRKWVHRRSGPELARRVDESLRYLAVDEVWLCSPKWLGLVDRIRLRHRATYDGSKRGLAGLRPPQSRASACELQRLRARLGQAPLFGRAGGGFNPPDATVGQRPKGSNGRLVERSPSIGDLLSGRHSDRGLSPRETHSRRGRPIEPLVLRLEEKLALQQCACQPGIATELALRARIVLACAEGRLIGEVARELAVTPRTVSKWRRRFVEQQLHPLCSCFGPVAPSEETSRTDDLDCSTMFSSEVASARPTAVAPDFHHREMT
jgi:transposase-like protein